MTPKEKRLRALSIYIYFIKIGFFTFGGGWSIIAQIQNQYVDKHSWLSETDLLDLVSIAKSLPGIMVINTAVLFGYKVGGPWCAVASAIGIATPSVIVLSVVTLFYDSFRSNPYVAKAMIGVRAAVVPIIFSAALRLRDSAFIDKVCYGIAAVAALICLFTPINNFVVVLIGAVFGLFYQRGRKNGTPS